MTYVPLVGPIVKLGLSCNAIKTFINTLRAARFQPRQNFGNFKCRSLSIPIPVVCTFIGIVLTAYSTYRLAHDIESAKAPEEVVSEDIVNVLSSAAMAFSILNWNKINRATVVDGISLSSAALAVIDGGTSIAGLIVHLESGFGKKIHA